jgi:hypothetical protein
MQFKVKVITTINQIAESFNYDRTILFNIQGLTPCHIMPLKARIDAPVGRSISVALEQGKLGTSPVILNSPF